MLLWLWLWLFSSHLNLLYFICNEMHCLIKRVSGGFFVVAPPALLPNGWASVQNCQLFRSKFFFSFCCLKLMEIQKYANETIQIHTIFLMAGHQYKIANYFAANSFSLSASWNWRKYKNTQIKKYKYTQMI